MSAEGIAAFWRLSLVSRPGAAPASLPAVSSPIAATGPLVERDSIVLRLSDPDAALAGVRLATDRGFPFAAEPFAREGDGWTLRMPAPALDRFEYALAVQRADGAARALDRSGQPAARAGRVRREVGGGAARATPPRRGWAPSACPARPTA